MSVEEAVEGNVTVLAATVGAAKYPSVNSRAFNVFVFGLALLLLIVMIFRLLLLIF